MSSMRMSRQRLRSLHVRLRHIALRLLMHDVQDLQRSALLGGRFRRQWRKRSGPNAAKAKHSLPQHLTLGHTGSG